MWKILDKKRLTDAEASAKGLFLVHWIRRRLVVLVGDVSQE
jgi:hypothetical protein